MRPSKLSSSPALYCIHTEIFGGDSECDQLYAELSNSYTDKCAELTILHEWRRNIHTYTKNVIERKHKILFQVVEFGTKRFSLLFTYKNYENVYMHTNYIHVVYIKNTLTPTHTHIRTRTNFSQIEVYMQLCLYRW